MQALVIDRVEKKTPKAGGNPFYVIHGESGEEMTSFDGAFENFGKGTRLNVELKIKGKHTNIDSYEVLESVDRPISRNGGGYKKDIEGLKVEYQLKARLQAIERASIEAQTAYNGAINLIVNKDYPEEANALINGAIDWGIAHLTDLKGQLAHMPDVGAKPKVKIPASKQAEAEELWPEETPSEGEEPIPKTTEELYAWAAKMMGWKDTKPVRTWLVNKVKIEEARIDSDPEGCYHETKALMGW